MTGISWRLDCFTAANQILASALRRIEDPTDLFNAIGVKMSASTQERFDTETDPEGNPWPASLRALTEGGKTLTDTAQLARSITHEADRTGVDIGTNLIYAAIHQFGGTIRAKTAKGLKFRRIGDNADTIVKSVTMPRRAYLGIDQDDLAEIEFLAGEFIANALGGTASISGAAS